MPGGSRGDWKRDSMHALHHRAVQPDIGFRDLPTMPCGTRVGLGSCVVHELHCRKVLSLARRHLRRLRCGDFVKCGICCVRSVQTGNVQSNGGESLHVMPGGSRGDWKRDSMRALQHRAVQSDIGFRDLPTMPRGTRVGPGSCVMYELHCRKVLGLPGKRVRGVSLRSVQSRVRCRGLSAMSSRHRTRNQLNFLPAMRCGQLLPNRGQYLPFVRPRT